MVHDDLQSQHVFLGLLRTEKPCIILVGFVSSLWPPIELFKELHLHDITGDKGRNVLFLAKLRPVDPCKPGMLFDFSDRLWAACGVLVQQPEYKVAQEDLTGLIARTSDQSIVRMLLYINKKHSKG